MSVFSRKVYYVSDVDLSQGVGPSVNELEFVDALLSTSLVEAVIFVPKTMASLRPSIRENVRWLVPFSVSRRNPASIVLYEIAFMLFVIRNYKDIRRSVFITRISFLPIGLFLVAPIIRNNFHIKTIGDGTFRYLLRFPFGGQLIRLHKFIYRSIVRNSRSVDMVTQKHKIDFGREIGFLDKCHVVSNMVNTKVFYPLDRLESRKSCGLSPYDYLYGYVGNDPFNRGALEAILASYILREKYAMNVAVLVVGGYDQITLEEILDGRDSSHIYMRGHVSYSEVPRLMNCMDVGVSFLPLWHRGASEQKVRQYLACGVVPVVTPGGSEFIKHVGVGFVSENNDIEDVAVSIKSALEAASELSGKCRSYAEDHLSHLRLASSRLEIWDCQAQN